MTQPTELEVLTAIDTALNSIGEDARKRVLVWVNSKFLGVDAGTLPEVSAAKPSMPLAPKKKTAISQKKKDRADKKPKTSYKFIKDLNLRPTGKASAIDFVDEKKPSNLKQKCVVALYYLLKILELEKAGIDHIYTVFKTVKWALPGNLPNMMHQAGSEGWLDTSNSDNITITNSGEHVVEHDLPRH